MFIKGFSGLFLAASLGLVAFGYHQLAGPDPMTVQAGGQQIALCDCCENCDCPDCICALVGCDCAVNGPQPCCFECPCCEDCLSTPAACPCDGCELICMGNCDCFSSCNSAAGCQSSGAEH